MKTNLKITLFVLLLSWGIVPAITAQTHLNNLLKSCETRASVEMNVVMNRDKDSGEISKLIKNVIIKNDKRLVDDFLTAFSRDKDQAEKIIENIKGGRTIPSLYQFTHDNKRISYSFTLTDDSNASVTYIERSGQNGWFFDIFGENHFNSEEFGLRLEELGKNLEGWGEEFGKQMEAWGNEFGPEMEKWGKEFEEKIKEMKPDTSRLHLNGGTLQQ